jgi:peptidoglycan/LPS O-acetylase OafA/YrhL
MRNDKLPGLDGLRAIAVALVLLFHRYLLPVGWLGVQIFFVLSGYLITRILARSKAQPLGEYLRNFYGRRALRIFPLYYAVIVLFYLATATGAKLAGVREGLPFAATYTYNFWYATKASGYSLFITHFWTLCVEEQFYLVWPFVMYLCPPRHTKRLLLGLIAIGPLLRVAGMWVLSQPHVSALPVPSVALDVLTTTHLDAFATGACFALFPWGGRPRALLLLAFAWLGAGAALVVTRHLPWASLGYPIGMAPGYGYLWGYTLINCLSGLLIDCLVNRRFVPAFFELRPLAYLGRISYGLYVLHYPMQAIADKALPHAAFSVRLGFQVVATVACASASFHFWEAPFLRLKDRWFRASSPVQAS